MIKKIHCELEYARNNKTFRKVNEFYYGINKVMEEWYLKRCAVFLNHRKSNTRAPLKLIIASQVLDRVQIDLVDMRTLMEKTMKMRSQTGLRPEMRRVQIVVWMTVASRVQPHLKQVRVRRRQEVGWNGGNSGTVESRVEVWNVVVV